MPGAKRTVNIIAYRYPFLELFFAFRTFFNLERFIQGDKNTTRANPRLTCQWPGRYSANGKKIYNCSCLLDKETEIQDTPSGLQLNIYCLF